MTGQAKRASEKEKRSPLPSFLGSEVDGGEGEGAEKASGRGSSQSSVFACSHEKEADGRMGWGKRGKGENLCSFSSSVSVCWVERGGGWKNGDFAPSPSEKYRRGGGNREEHRNCRHINGRRRQRRRKNLPGKCALDRKRGL